MPRVFPHVGIAGVVLACNCQAQGQVPMAKDTCKCNSDQPGETRGGNGRLGESGGGNGRSG